MGKKSDIERDIEEFEAQLVRVCPEAAEGLAVSGPPPPPLSLREQIALLRSLPDNAGLDAFMTAWYAATPNTSPSGKHS